MNDPTSQPLNSSQSQGTGKRSSISNIARTGQVLTFVMIQLVVLVACVLLYMTLDVSDQPRVEATPRGSGTYWFLPWIGAILMFGAVIGAFLLPRKLRRVALSKYRQIGERVRMPVHFEAILTPALTDFAGACQASALVGQSLLQFAAIVNLMLMYLDGHLLHLLLAAACVVGIVLQIPLSSRLSKAIEFAASGAEEEG